MSLQDKIENICHHFEKALIEANKILFLEADNQPLHNLSWNIKFISRKYLWWQIMHSFMYINPILFWHL